MFSASSEEMNFNFFDGNDTNLFKEPPKLESFFVNDPKQYRPDILQLQTIFNDNFQITDNKFPHIPDLFASSSNNQTAFTTPRKQIVIKMQSSTIKKRSISKNRKRVNFHGHIFESNGSKESLKTTDEMQHLNEFSLESFLRHKTPKKKIMNK